MSDSTEAMPAAGSRPEAVRAGAAGTSAPAPAPGYRSSPYTPTQNSRPRATRR